MAKHQFQTEVNQLLQIIVHSLYSHKEIFLRELVSNASDALDKLKYLTLTDDSHKDLAFDPRIDIEFDEKNKKTLTISDSGIGMNEEDLVENLGTIASSGTRRFVEMMTGDAKQDASLIGQFGVGFYSAFMVSDKLEVTSKKAGEEQAYCWTSDGKGEYEVTQAERDRNGTTVVCHLNEDGMDYSSRWRIEDIVKKYSNHIPFPIFIRYEVEQDKKTDQRVEQINAASAFWKRPKSELKDSDYNEFYKTLTHDTDEPLLHIHTHAEGTQEYSTLFYVPKKAPPDMFHMDYQPGVKLYVKRVFITDDAKELMPPYLRFVRGIIDSEDLPLNIGRETLQQNRLLTNIRNTSVKKILAEFGEVAKDGEKYEPLYAEFRVPLKEGVYQDYANREAILELLRYRSTREEGYTSFAEYKQRMKPDQKAIYYLTGENEDTLRNSPLLELYRQKDIEVLLLADEIDEIVTPTIDKYKDTELRSVNRSDAAEDLKTEKDKNSEKEVTKLVGKMKDVLKEQVKDVRASTRLSDSPSCIVADEKDPTIKMQHILKAMGQTETSEIKPILEVNPNHEIVRKLNDESTDDVIADVSWLLFEQALLIEGAELKDPTQFAKRLNRVMARAL